MIKWSITNMESYKDTGIVISAHWKCSNEELIKTGHSVFNLDFLNPTQPNIIVTNNEEGASEEIIIEQPVVVEKNIIPYSELTEQDVLNWVWTDGGVDRNLVEESITKELNDLTNPVVVKNPLPWDK